MRFLHFIAEPCQLLLGTKEFGTHRARFGTLRGMTQLIGQCAEMVLKSPLEEQQGRAGNLPAARDMPSALAASGRWASMLPWVSP